MGQYNAMSGRTLFDIEQDMQFLLDCHPPDDAIEPGYAEALKKQLDLVLEMRGQKLDSYLYVASQLEGEEIVQRVEGEKLIAAANAKKAHREWLLANLKRVMEASGNTELKSAKGKTIKIVRNGGLPSVVIADGVAPDDVPEAYVKTKKEFNREAIRTALEEVGELPFAKLAERGTRLSVSYQE